MTPPPLTDQLIETLLYQDEGAALDFKRDAYPFEGATDRQKSELLKDILAFANAWRHATAYILIGVEDVPGGRGIVHGVERHPDDAALQEFVNTKTNQPVEFHYRAREIDGRQIGIIEIPLQPRPRYLNKDFGKLKANEVRVRRSSSTIIARPDEVARMGAAVGATPAPKIAAALGRADKDLRIGLHLEASSVSFSLPASIPNYTKGGGIYGAVLDFDSNRNFWRGFAAYARDVGHLRSFQVAIDNRGTAPLQRAQIVARAAQGQGLRLATYAAPRPSTTTHGSLAHLVARADPHAWTIVERGKAWEASAETGTLLPGASVWTPELFVGADASGRYTIDLVILAENLPEPLRFEASVTLRVREADLSFEAIRDWHNGSPPLDILT